MLAHALFPPITECVYLSIVKHVARPERWTELLGMVVLSEEVARFLTELVKARATILINGAPEFGGSGACTRKPIDADSTSWSNGELPVK